MLDLGFTQLNLIKLGISIGVLVGFMILSRLYLRVISPFLVKLCDKTPKKYNYIVVSAFCLPTTVFLVFIGLFGFTWYLAQSFGYADTTLLLIFLQKCFRVGMIIYLSWGLFSASDIFTELLKSLSTKLDLETGKTASRFLGYIFKGIVLALSSVIIINEFGYDVNGIIAGLGLGGLTVALAAKDSASNFFGGVIIIFEKPFEMGDWITSGSIEGTVEDITIRSTKIRTVSNALTIVPNSLLAAEPITNWTKMKMRRAQMMLMLEHTTSPESVTLILSQIREYLTTNDAIISDTVVVRLSDFTTEGINVSIIYFTKTVDLKEHQGIKEVTNLKIMEILNENGAALTLLRKGI